MDDERKKPPRKGGPKSSGAGRGGERPRPSGKAGFAGKPRFEGSKKPLRARGDDDGAPRARRPQREFKRDDRPRDGGGDRPFRVEGDKKPFRPRRDDGGAPRTERPRRDFKRDDRSHEGGGDRPFRAEGDRKPFRPRRDDDGAPHTERPRRDFKRDDRPHEGGGDRPFRAEGDRKPFRPRRDDDGAPRADRPQRDFKRDGGKKRPGRFERAERKAGDAATGDRPFRPEGNRKPFRPRRDDDGAPRAERPQRDFKRGDRPQDDRRPKSADRGDRRPFARSGDAASAAEGERIAKRLARAGIASRRDAEELIAAGRIRVNGKVLSSPAFNVLPDDTVELDGTAIPPIERTRLFLFHKPAGVVTTNRDPEGRRTVFDVLPKDLPRLMTIGRLDINTEGLLLLTNDGGLARVLELPATGWLRRYRVRVHGKADEKALADLKNGVAVDGVFYGSIEAVLDREQGTNAWLTIGLREGKNREVKNILGALGLEVTRLIRVSYGPFQLGELPEGHVWEMKGRTLRDQLGERLIEEAGANFDADIAKPFSNRPVRREGERDEAHDERNRAAPRAERAPIGEGGLIKKRWRDRDDKREHALGRLSTTKPDRGQGRGFGTKSGERADKRFEPTEPRKANVWMAPGARPQGKKKDADAGSRAGKPKGKPAAKFGFGKPRGERPAGATGADRSRKDRPSGPRKGKPDADRRR
jgi:23S rRNA pseudouridine2605 synthase